MHSYKSIVSLCILSNHISRHVESTIFKLLISTFPFTNELYYQFKIENADPYCNLELCSGSPVMLLAVWYFCYNGVPTETGVYRFDRLSKTILLKKALYT